MPKPTSLANVAVHYLERYAASEASLRRVLRNRIMRAAMDNPEFAHDSEKHRELYSVIDTIVEKHKATGALNDATYAEAKTGSLRRMGRSRHAIQQKLVLKGVARESIEQALHHVDGEDTYEESEKKAAVAFARRRKLGPFRIREKEEEGYKKELAAMARGGFSLSIARQVLENED